MERELDAYHRTVAMNELKPIRSLETPLKQKSTRAVVPDHATFLHDLSKITSCMEFIGTH